MKLFKTTDEKLAELGFVKTYESKNGVEYKRNNAEFDFVQTVALLHKSSGYHIIQSYDEDLCDTKGIGNTCVGMEIYELKLFMKKMKEIGWKPIKKKQEQWQ